MFRAASAAARVALLPVAHRSSLPIIVRAGIHFSRVKPHVTAPAAKPPAAHAAGPQPNETSLAPPAASHAPAAAAALGHGSSTDRRVRDSRFGIIRCAHRTLVFMFKVARYSRLLSCECCLLKRFVQPKGVGCDGQ
jgi:hypothetical protein